MKILSAAFVLSLLLGGAPFQCGKGEDHGRELQDTPSEALWQLSETFREQGDESARRVTLERLIERYPTSREANRAEMALEGRDVGVDEVPEGRDDGIIPGLPEDEQPEPNEDPDDDSDDDSDDAS